MTEQVMGRVYHGNKNIAFVELNSAGQQLPDDTPLYAHPAEHKETDAESRAAWIAVVLQKCPAATIRVANDLAVANAPNGMLVGSWTPAVWMVK